MRGDSTAYITSNAKMNPEAESPSNQRQPEDPEGMSEGASISRSNSRSSTLQRQLSSQLNPDYYNLCWKDIRQKEKVEEQVFW